MHPILIVILVKIALLIWWKILRTLHRKKAPVIVVYLWISPVVALAGYLAYIPLNYILDILIAN